MHKLSVPGAAWVAVKIQGILRLIPGCILISFQRSYKAGGTGKERVLMSKPTMHLISRDGRPQSSGICMACSLLSAISHVAASCIGESHVPSESQNCPRQPCSGTKFDPSILVCVRSNCHTNYSFQFARITSNQHDDAQRPDYTYQQVYCPQAILRWTTCAEGLSGCARRRPSLPRQGSNVYRGA